MCIEETIGTYRRKKNRNFFSHSSYSHFYLSNNFFTLFHFISFHFFHLAFQHPREEGYERRILINTLKRNNVFILFAYSHLLLYIYFLSYRFFWAGGNRDWCRFVRGGWIVMLLLLNVECDGKYYSDLDMKKNIFILFLKDFIPSALCRFSYSYKYVIIIRFTYFYILLLHFFFLVWCHYWKVCIYV
jgi:hypothetical protein